MTKVIIEVVAGVGHGPTELAAFDAAEMEAGVADCNLMRLSSLVPPGAKVVDVKGPTTKNPGWGDKLYCVYAEKRTSRPEEAVWAGVGWIMLDNGQKGLFCEHDGGSRQAVEQQIRSTLISFMKVRGLPPDESLIQMRVVGTTCREQPACALVMAVYSAESW